MPRLFLLTILVLISAPAAAQPSEERANTERRLAMLQEQIRDDETRLQRTRSDEAASVTQLRRINRRVAILAEIVDTYDGRIRESTAERDRIWAEIQALEAEIDALKREYRERATHAYKYGRLHDVALVLSAGSINEVLVRVKYLRLFSDARSRQLDDIRRATTAREARRDELERVLQQTRQLRRDAMREREQLRDSRSQREQLVDRLRGQRQAIEDALEAKRLDAEALASRVRELIAAENARRSNSASEADLAAFAALSGSFRSNQGRLPWPSPGTVIESFGVVVNPVYGTRTQNDGVMIATPEAAEVRAVFEGTVAIVDVLPDLGRFVILTHGEYMTIYGNLSRVFVSPGETVGPGVLIARSGTEQHSRGPGVFFAVSHAGSFRNPSDWLASR